MLLSLGLEMEIDAGTPMLPSVSMPKVPYTLAPFEPIFSGTQIQQNLVRREPKLTCGIQDH